MDVICLQEEAFYKLIETVVDRINEKKGISENRWIRGEEAMEVLGIKSRTTLQKLRDDGWIRFSQPNKKIIMYDRASILEYLENHAKDSF
ncbi:MAG: helix-turn-helix domain-containing protein [Flavobacteriales bacterium]|nr:helix-turn-helix domain-containing protein [Flavobacteriales bacterium]